MKQKLVLVIAGILLLTGCSIFTSERDKGGDKYQLEFQPQPSLYNEPQLVRISSSIKNSKIYYTIDGSEPKRSSMLYTKPIEITQNTTIKARPYGRLWHRGGTIAADYKLAPETPIFVPSVGIYESPIEITITSNTENAIIYYTTDGEEPTQYSPNYTEPIKISQHMTLKAKAFKRGWSDSSEEVAEYFIVPGMIYVQGGLFEMGSADGYVEERPVHNVELSSFLIGKYEVTQSEWIEIMGENPSFFEGAERPVEQISWYDAIEYCNKRSVNEGLEPTYSIKGVTNPELWSEGVVECNWNSNGYRLPTEAEWEYAAKGGAKQMNEFRYSGDDTIEKVAWYYDNSNSQTQRVGTKQGNSLGVYDMSGNVWEWCWDHYAKGYHDSKKVNPKGPPEGTSVVVRGGSWNNSPIHCRPSSRTETKPSFTYRSYGFRVARSKL
ncbi:MAG: SUMF1/EgtB/PvdO family nonheme iron enzyme [Candidatus Cloacimonadia bacterium]